MSAELRRHLLSLAEQRGEGSFCPSEVARAASEDWRPLMPTVREVGAQMIAEGLLLCTQRGEPADPLTTRGAIRFRRAQRA
jgi:hypothetical protein